MCYPRIESENIFHSTHLGSDSCYKMLIQFFVFTSLLLTLYTYQVMTITTFVLLGKFYSMKPISVMDDNRHFVSTVLGILFCKEVNTLSLTEVRFLFHFSLGWPGRKQVRSLSSLPSNGKSNLPSCLRMNAITSEDSQ